MGKLIVKKGITENINDRLMCFYNIGESKLYTLVYFKNNNRYYKISDQNPTQVINNLIASGISYEDIFNQVYTEGEVC